MLTPVLIITVITLLLFWLIMLRGSYYELMSPVSLMLLGLFVSFCLATVGYTSWNHITITWKTACVAIFGSLSALIGGLAAIRLYERARGGRGQILGTEDLKVLYEAPVWKYGVVAILLVIAIVVRVTETYKIGAALGVDLSSYSTVSSAVRNALEAINTSEGMLFGTGFSILERQLEKVASAAGFVSVVLLALNCVRGNIRGGLSAAAIFVLSSIFSLVSGSRTAIAYYVVAFLIALFIILVQFGKPAKRIAAIMFAACVGAAVGGSVLFYEASALIGREAASGPLEYISFYFGGGLPSFQYILDGGQFAGLAPGVRTFYYLFAVPFKLGLIDAYPSYSIAWVDMGGHPSNIFTGFARYYLDYGIQGVVLLSFVGAFITTIIYMYARSRASVPLAVLAAFLGSYSFDFAREEFVFSRLLSPNQILIVLIMLAIAVFLSSSIKNDIKIVLAKLKTSKIITKQQ